MVGVFRRSLSFNPSRPSTPKPPISHHTRSISLPSRSHPLISLLRDKTSDIIHSWSASKPSSRDSSAWLADGLSRLKDLHDCLDDALQLPQSQESLRRQPGTVVDKILEDFLRLVDAYGIFRTLILSLREEHSAADVAIRRRDEPKVAVYGKERRRIAKEMRGLVSAVRYVGENGRPRSAVVCVGDAEIVDVIGDVVEATVVVSLAVFDGIAVSMVGAKRGSYFPTIMTKKKKKREKVNDDDEGMREFATECLCGLRKKSDGEIREASKKMKELEGCVALIESGGERVFRGLISARVSLLNTFTQ